MTNTGPSPDLRCRTTSSNVFEILCPRLRHYFLTHNYYVHKLVYNAAASVESVSPISATGIEDLLVHFWKAQLIVVEIKIFYCCKGSAT